MYLVPVRSAAIEHVVPKISYAGEYPTAPLGVSAPSGFFLTVSVHFVAPAATTGELTVLGKERRKERRRGGKGRKGEG